MKKLKIYRTVFLLLLIIGITLFSIEILRTPVPAGPGDVTAPVGPPENNNLKYYISILSGIIGLFGTFITSILLWKKEKLKMKSMELENQKTELEIEKLKRDLKKDTE